MEQERDRACAEVETARGEYRELEAEHLKKQAGHQRARRRAARLGIAVAVLVVLLAVTILVAWWLIT